MKRITFLNWSLLALLVLASVSAVAADYDPLAVSKTDQIRTTDLTVSVMLPISLVDSSPKRTRCGG